MSDTIQFNYKDHWQEKEINLERINNIDKSWGFTISGGIDMPFVNHHFTSIIIINIHENSLAYRDKQLKLYDIILSVNNIDFTNIKHQTAVDILRTAGENIQLRIRRLSPFKLEIIELEHNGQLGITIAGGIGTEYFLKDHGIFIVDIKKYQTNKQLDIGDRLLQISSTYNTYDLRFVTHEKARKYIQLACIESQKIRLYVGHTRFNNSMDVQTISSHDENSRNTKYRATLLSRQNPRTILLENNSKDKVNKTSANEPIIKTEYQDVHDKIINRKQNRLHTDYINEKDLALDNHQRYENHNKLLKNRLSNGDHNSQVLPATEPERSYIVRVTRAQTVLTSKPDHEINTNAKNSNVDQNSRYKENNSCRNTGTKKRVAQSLELRKQAIHNAYVEKLRREENRINQPVRSSFDGRVRWQVS